MESGNTAGDESPRARQQSGDFQRHNSGLDERIRSGSGSFAAPDAADDGDASMSNDESMSSSSSLEIEEIPDLERDQQLERQQNAGHDGRSNSFDDFARQLPYQDAADPPRTGNFSFDVVDTSLGIASASTTQSMWLLTQFAPAMSKTMRSADPSADMEDDEPFDEETEKAQAAQVSNNGGAAQVGEGGENRSGNRRVAWASHSAHVELPEGVRLTAAKNEVTGVQLRLRSNVPFLMAIDTANWMLPLGHGPRARVMVDTRFVPPHMLKVEAFVVGCVEDENSDLVMETLERRGVSSRAAREHAVYLRIRISEHLDPGVYELPLRVFTQDAGFRDEQLTWSSSFAVRVVDFYAHCVALEIADRVRICADEPRDVAVFHEQLHFMQRLAPNFRIKLAVNHPEFFSQAYTPPQVADYVPLLPLACSDLEVTRRLANDARARGGHVCWYVCCGPAFPNQFVSSPLVEGELVGYLTFFFELDGFLRWNYCLWPNQPWDDLRWRAPMWKVGDMYFVLPGLDGWPVETLRLESLRFAGQAFELLALAQEALAPAQMQQLQRTVAEQILRSSDFEEFGRCADRAREDLYSLDPLDYQRAKTIILDTLAASAAKSNAA
ncbi:hypothetical protein BBP00_00006964 [Phytophthora kernoviae]|uniref:Glycoside hydrolase 123 catalytic domain-containing protein n=1 Tax=Phytophthora kernoviae TaxID=325452 RepID=A0A3F2RJP9_9STRA|nr:hypothetical protein BBP00_00006964 [Phytophthora kernoviae]